MEEIARLNRQLEALNKIRSALSNCQSIDDIVQTAVWEVRRSLNSQVASIFLFNKEGVIKRVAIDGVDKNGNLISNDWLAEEQYEPGKSFSGQLIHPTGEDSGFSRPLISNDIFQEFTLKYGQEYLEKLGRLKQAISVPLNGLHRTLGTIEVLNKNKDDSRFTENDTYYLMFIGNLVSSFISNVKGQHRQTIYNQITEWLFNAESKTEPIKMKEIYGFLAKSLIHPVTPFKVCIIRAINEHGDFEAIVQEGTEDIDWSLRNNNPVKIDHKTTVSRVSEKKEPLYEEITRENIDQGKFHNPDWILANNLKSLASLPLIANRETVGTITVYIGYKYKFFESNQKFLGNIAFVTASIIAADRSRKKLDAVQRELNTERHKFFAMSRRVSYDSVMKGFLHQYKNELIDFSQAFFNLSAESTKSIKQKETIISEQRKWIRRRVEEISQEFREDNNDSDIVDINKLVKYIVRLFVSDEKDIYLAENYDEDIPKIEVSEAKIKDVIYNLVNNAIAAIERVKHNGQLSVETSIVTLNRLQYIQIMIKDNGDGISNEDQERIFEQGFSNRKKEGGTGMGLFIANEVIANYGGKISVDSKKGKGTAFKVYIPLRYMV